MRFCGFRTRYTWISLICRTTLAVKQLFHGKDKDPLFVIVRSFLYGREIQSVGGRECRHRWGKYFQGPVRVLGCVGEAGSVHVFGPQLPSGLTPRLSINARNGSFMPDSRILWFRVGEWEGISEIGRVAFGRDSSKSRI